MAHKVLAVPGLAFSRSWRDSHGAIPWEQFNWLKKPALSQDTALSTLPLALTFLFHPLRRALVILSRLTPRVEDHRPLELNAPS